MADAAVSLRDADGAYLGRTTATDQAGGFCIAGLTPGTYGLEVRVDDYLFAQISRVIVADDTSSVPLTGVLPSFRLYPPWPNPASDKVSFRLSISRPTPLRVAVHDLRGRLVRSWASADAEPGARTFRWDGRDAAGRPVPSGHYLLRVVASDHVATKHVLLTR